MQVPDEVTLSKQVNEYSRFYLLNIMVSYYAYIPYAHLALTMLRLLMSKAQGCKDFWKPSKPCHIGIH